MGKSKRTPAPPDPEPEAESGVSEGDLEHWRRLSKRQGYLDDVGALRLIAEVRRYRRQFEEMQGLRNQAYAVNARLRARIAELEAEVGRLREALVDACDIMDTRGRTTDDGANRMMWVRYWDVMRKNMARALGEVRAKVAANDAADEAIADRDEAFRQNEASVVAYGNARAEVERLRAHIDAAGDGMNLVALLDLYHDRELAARAEVGRLREIMDHAYRAGLEEALRLVDERINHHPGQAIARLIGLRAARDVIRARIGQKVKEGE